MELEGEVEQPYRSQRLQALPQKIEPEAVLIESQAPECRGCGRAMSYHDRRSVSWWARFGKLKVGRWVFVAPRAVTSAERCWIIGAWKRDESVDPWPG
jgi:hypothetical protein